MRVDASDVPQWDENPLLQVRRNESTLSILTSTNVMYWVWREGHPLDQFPWKGGRGRLSLIHEAPIIVRETPDVKEIRQNRTRARLVTRTERYTFVRMSEHEVKEPPYLELPVGPVPEDDATPVAVIWKILRLLTLRSGLTRV
jgi:hypothetical protein